MYTPQVIPTLMTSKSIQKTSSGERTETQPVGNGHLPFRMYLSTYSVMAVGAGGPGTRGNGVGESMNLIGSEGQPYQSDVYTLLYVNSGPNNRSGT